MEKLSAEEKAFQDKIEAGRDLAANIHFSPFARPFGLVTDSKGSVNGIHVKDPLTPERLKKATDNMLDNFMDWKGHDDL